MSQIRKQNLVGKLTKYEVQSAVPEGTFPCNLLRMHWDVLLDLVESQSETLCDLIQLAADAKEERRLEARRNLARRARERNAANVLEEEDHPETTLFNSAKRYKPLVARQRTTIGPRYQGFVFQLSSFLMQVF